LGKTTLKLLKKFLESVTNLIYFYQNMNYYMNNGNIKNHIFVYNVKKEFKNLSLLLYNEFE